MRNNEFNIILNYLQQAYKKVKRERKINQEGASKDFPMKSQELVAAEHEFDVLSSLASDLGVPNPWIEAEFNDRDSIVED